MKKLVLFLALTVFVLSSGVCVFASDSYQMGSPFMVKMGDNDWEVKAASYLEKSFNKDQKQIDVIMSFTNVSSQNKTQVINPDNWSFFVVGSNNGSYKSDSLGFKMDPGNANWWNAQDVLAGSSFAARIPVRMPKEVAARKVVIMADIANPSQVNIEIPSSLTNKTTPIDRVPYKAVSSSYSSGAHASSSHATNSYTQPAPQSQGRVYNGVESDAQAGFGLMVGHIIGISGIYWPDMGLPLGGQMIIAKTSNVDSLSFNGRVHLKLLALPFGRISIAPQVGYQFSVSGNVSKSTYGLVGVAEFIMPLPTYVSAGKKFIERQDMWLSFFTLDKVKAIGISGEIGYYGTGIRSIDLSDPDKLTHGFSMAGHIYL